MDKRTAESIHRQAIEVLKKTFPEIKVTFKGGSYSDSFYTMKIEFAETAPNGEAMTAEYSALLKWHIQYGVSQDLIEKGFDHPRLGHCEVVGIKTKNTKYPIIVKATNGQKYKFSERDIKFYANA